MTIVFALLLALQQAPAAAQDTVVPPQGAVVEISGDSLFTLYWSTSAYSAEERAQRITVALERIADHGLAPADTFGIVNEATRTEITFAGAPFFFLTDADAAGAGIPRAEAAKRYVATLRVHVKADSEHRTPAALWRDGVKAIIATAVLLVVFLLMNVAFPRLYAFLESSGARITDAMRRIGVEGIVGDKASTVLLALARFLRMALVLVALAIYVPLVLRLFPQTAGFAGRLISEVKTPIGTALLALVEYIPNLVYIALIVFGTRLVLRIVHAFFLAVERGSVRIRRFDVEWAIPTYEIVRPLILALAFALIFPYLPGSNSDAIKGVSIFVGVLVSFGSSSAVSNLVAGIVLLYSRAFRMGDWVRIGTVEGKVIARTLLVTRVRTQKNVEVSVPSSVVLGSAIENFTEKARSGTLILHTEVTIGYDAPWRTVHELLIAAARDTMHILEQPSPFVLQTSLNDFNVSYQINAYTDNPDGQPAIYGDLHRNIQEKFNGAGVEIMSPNYHAVRDGNVITIPEAQRAEGYRAPSFRVDTDPE